MANELNIALAKSGLTVTAQRYQAGAAVGSAISCPEVGTSGFYSGNMTGTAGTYQLTFRSAGANVGSGSIVWDGTAEVAPSTLTAPQVRTELGTELGRIDTTISSRLAPNGTLATVTTLTNAPSVPSAAAIASQVRTELGTELGRIDAAISSRLAPSGTLARVTLVDTATTLTNAPASVTPSDIWSHATRTLTSASGPTAVQIRQEMDSNSTQLSAIKAKTDAVNVDRINNTATLSQVGNLLAQANS